MKMGGGEEGNDPVVKISCGRNTEDKDIHNIPPGCVDFAKKIRRKALTAKQKEE